MSHKFTSGQRVQHMYLGVEATIVTVLTDYTPCRYDVQYDGMDNTITACESVLTADTTSRYEVPAIQASLDGLDQMVQAAMSARIIGVLSSYQLGRITDQVADAKLNMYRRASVPSEYL